MTKTQRRRTARAARDALDAAAPLDYNAATKLLNNPSRWKRLHDALRDLLEIEFTSPFIDRELLCPEHAHLIVHLDLLRRPADSASSSTRRPLPTPALQQRVAAALDAIVVLCATAKRLRPWSFLYQCFWERLCASGAMKTPLQPSAIDKWVRYTKARGIPLLLSWSNKIFDPDQLLEPLRAFLITPQPAGCKGTDVPVTVGLRFVQATITTSVLERLHMLLLQPTENPDALLVDPTSLRTLWFHSNPFYAPELSVFTSLLADPKARRVDELRLEKFVVEDAPAVALRAFKASLSQVFVSVLAIKSQGDAPLSLSLAETSLSPDHLDLLREALAHATRPVCALSLSGVAAYTHDTWESLTKLVYLPLPTVTARAVLNLSSVTCPERPSTTVGTLVQDSIESLWSRGVDVQENVECCFCDATLCESPDNNDPLRVDVPPYTFYRIKGYYAPTGTLRLTVRRSTDSGESESVTGWVKVSDATQLRVDGLDIVGTSFTRLVFDYGGPALELTPAIGARIKALSFRETGGWMSTRLPEILSHCPQLEELSLGGAELTASGSPPFWDNPDFKLPPSIRFLNLSQCDLRDISLHGLEAFPLQYLSLLSNPIGQRGVESLLAMLRKNKELQFVELNPQFSDPPALCTSLHSQIDDMLGREYLHARDKAAVLSVLAHIQRRDPQRAYPGDGVVALVFAFAGTKPRQAVNWTF